MRPGVEGMRGRNIYLIFIIAFFMHLLYPLVSDGQVGNAPSDITPVPEPVEAIHIVRSSAGEGGTISPSGKVTVKGGTIQAFAVKPDPCYYISSIEVDGSPVAISDRLSLSSISYTFANITSDHNINAIFRRRIYTITATARNITLAEAEVAGTEMEAAITEAEPAANEIGVTATKTEAAVPVHGGMDPSGMVTVLCGDDQTFTITAHKGYRVKDVLVDNASQGAMNSYTFANVMSDHRIVAIFEPDVHPAFHRITASAGDGGTISPSGIVRVKRGSDQTFTMQPNEGYHVKALLVDGSVKKPAGSYTFESVTSNHTIVAVFEINTYTIQASAGIGGSISPSGAVRVRHGDDMTFTIRPKPCYRISEILVDGAATASVDSSSNKIQASFTFANVTSNHTISVTFEKKIYTITATSAHRGTILPSGAVTVTCGEDQTFTITPDEGYRVRDVLVDGSSMGIQESYTFSDVRSGHTIEAEFEELLLEIAEVRNSTEGFPQKAGDVITVVAILESNSAPAERGEFDIGDGIIAKTLYNDGTHGDLLAGDDIWTGQYEVGQGDDVEDALLAVRLFALEGVVEKSGIGRITIDTVPPRISGIVSEPDPAGEGNITVTVAFHEDGSGMDENTPLNVSFVTSGGETASVSGTYVDMNTWQGTGEILRNYRDGKATIIAHGGQDRAGNALSPPEASASFWIDIIEEIEWVNHDAVAPLKAGDVLKVWMKGEEGKAALFEIEGVVAGIEMDEIEPGMYEGSYAIQKGDSAAAARVICHLGDVEEIAAQTIVIDTVDPGVESLLSEPELTRAGSVTITVIFTEEMDMSIGPSVVFTPGRGGQSITVNGGYEDNRAWRGESVITGELENGTAKVSVSGARDIAGNLMGLYEKADAFVIDTIPPDESQAKVLVNDGVEYTNSQALKITWSGFTDQHGIDGYYYSLADGSGTPDGIYTEETTGNLEAIGEHVTVYVWAKDEAGNIGDASHSSVVIDTEAPKVTRVSAPEIIKSGRVTIGVQFHDDESGMNDDPAGIRVEIRMQNGMNRISLETENYSSDGLWMGTGMVMDGMNDDAAILLISGARDKAGNVMPANSDNHLIVDTESPDPPDDFTATPDAAGLIRLEWQRPIASDVQGYRIYQLSPVEKVLEDHIPDPSVDHEVKMEDGIYRFGISTIDKAGNESETTLSNFAEADGTIPDDVTSLISESLPWGKIRLSWTPSTSTDTVIYEIDYDNKIANSEETTWVSEQLENDRLYTFTVKAVDEVGNKSQGASTERQVVHNKPPAAEIEAVEETGSDFSIKYRLSDREEEGLKIICEYAEANSGEWLPASVDGRTESITRYDGEIVWNSREDIPSAIGVHVEFRIIPEDSEQKGEAGDVELEITNILGDYNDDGEVDFADLGIFQIAWDEQDISKELGPATGEPPELVPHPDGIVDFEDLVAFGLMWKWSSNEDSKAPIQWLAKGKGDANALRIPELVPVLEIHDDRFLTVSLPTDGLMGNINIEYDPGAIQISSIQLPSSSNALFLTDTDHPGRVVLAFVDPASDSSEGSRSKVTMSLEWKQYAEDVEIFCHYDLRDHNNQKLTHGLLSKTIHHLPGSCALFQNYPNPCNPTTWIPFQLAEDSDVTVRIFNSTGRLVRTLELGHQGAGIYKSARRAAYWDGRNENGEELGSDVYFYSIRAGRFTQTRKMIVLR